MIGKITKGTSFAGALRYDITKDKAQVLDSNLAVVPGDWNAAASEMDAVADCNSRCSKRVLHFSFSAAHNEQLTDAQWRQGATAALKELGLEHHQHVITRHHDAGHDHIHVVANRIGPDGKAWNDSNDRARTHNAARAIEKSLGLEKGREREVAGDGRFERVRSDLRDSIKSARGGSIDSFKSEMSKRGYNVIEHRQSTGRLAGMSIQCMKDGKTWKASELQKGGARSIIVQLNKQREQEHQTRTSNAAMLGSAGGKALAGVLPGGGLALRVARAASKTAASTNKKQREMEK